MSDVNVESAATKVVGAEGAKVIVIRASEWLRGIPGDGELRTKDGRMCCLGIDAVACGVNPALLVGKTMPRNLASRHAATQYKRDWSRPAPIETLSVVKEWDNDKSLGDVAAYINDDSGINDEERIARLRPVFAAARREIEWRPNE